MSYVESSNPELRPASKPPRTSIYEYLPILRLPRWSFRKAIGKTRFSRLASEPEDDWKAFTPKRKRIAYSTVVESTVPLEIYLVLSKYVSTLRSLQTN
jgi:hypothetical protein